MSSQGSALSSPLNALSIPAPLEEKLKSKLIKRSMHNSHTLEDTVEVKTGGRTGENNIIIVNIPLYNFTASNLGEWPVRVPVKPQF